MILRDMPPVAQPDRAKVMTQIKEYIGLPGRELDVRLINAHR
jgi:hypothetical protein